MKKPKLFNNKIKINNQNLNHYKKESKKYSIKLIKKTKL